MTRLALNLLIAVALLWCGLHLHIGAAEAAERTAHAQPADPAQDDDHRTAPEQAAHHHHCPLAPDQRITASDAMPPPARDRAQPHPVVPLRSLSRAPPLEPPSA